MRCHSQLWRRHGLYAKSLRKCAACGGEARRTLWLRTLDYTRFLNIKYAKGAAYRSSGRAPLYNRVVGDVFYRNVIPTLRLEFTARTPERIREDLSVVNKP
ncbi:hypothetical protein [Porphyromonas gulae]|uniref:hypothetical protein n=1 Tax=Porphyromonas gulae TaxID=111105 RepID=UPI00126989A3|nr:hypothetical protein [Porphyromonas gulae]